MHHVPRRFLCLVLILSAAQDVRAQEPRVTGTDLDVLVTAIHRIHPHPYRLFPASGFDSVAAELKIRLASLSPHRATLETQRLLAMVGDGHTEWAALPESLRGQWLPLLFRRFEEGWFVRTGDPNYRQLFGKPIIRMSGVPMHEAVQRIMPYVSGDNELGKLDGAGSFLRNVRILHALELTAGAADEIPITVAESNGSETTVSVRATSDSWVLADWRDVETVLSPDVTDPLYQRLDGNYACAWLPDEAVLYVLFDEVHDDDDVTIADFFGGVYDFARRVEPGKLVLDIRENSGGNLDLNGPILRGLIATPFLDRPGRFFVIIGGDTFSAAMNLAVLLERYTHALFVGSPTGASPNHFGDTRAVELPNSGIRVEISELYWQNSDPRDERPWITPDLVANPSAAALVAGRDPALEIILRFQPTRDVVAGFGAPMKRWRRSNQLQMPMWPPLLEPAARPLDGRQRSSELTVEACPTE